MSNTFEGGYSPEDKSRKLPDGELRDRMDAGIQEGYGDQPPLPGTSIHSPSEGLAVDELRIILDRPEIGE